MRDVRMSISDFSRPRIAKVYSKLFAILPAILSEEMDFNKNERSFSTLYIALENKFWISLKSKLINAFALN